MTKKLVSIILMLVLSLSTLGVLTGCETMGRWTGEGAEEVEEGAEAFEEGYEEGKSN